MRTRTWGRACWGLTACLSVACGGDGEPGAGDAGGGLDAAASDGGGKGEDRFAEARQACVDRINFYRKNAGVEPLARWTGAEGCSDQQSQDDADGAGAHGSFGDCGERAQNACPGYGSTDAVVTDCLDAMWDEGPPPTTPCDGDCFLAHGHYINMSNPGYTRVACGFYDMPDGRIWSNHNFK